MRILHIASENIAGVPGILVRAERNRGHYSRLMTFFKSPYEQWDDIVLSLPFSYTGNLKWLKKLTKTGTYRHHQKTGNPPLWNPSDLSKFLYTLRDVSWNYKIRPLLDFILSFDLYILEGGTGLLRCGKIIEIIKSAGKKVAILYLGSDLRTRGAMPKIESLADSILTTEFDHLSFHPDINHIFFPFEVNRFRRKEILKSSTPTICHCPTDRYLKGTEYLLDAVQNLKKRCDLEFLLMENIPHERVMKLKRERCDVLVDQLTDLGGYGYGMNSMEALSMGIPCVTYINEDYERYIPDHPFINANKNNIEQVLGKALKNPGFLKEKGREGKKWVTEYHDYLNVSDRMFEIIF